jgi:WD40 repeat protein/formylglycine-generating enzyme required for sulfatase activity
MPKGPGDIAKRPAKKAAPALPKKIDYAMNTIVWPRKAPAPAVAPFDTAQAKKHQQAWARFLGLPVEKEIDLGGGTKIAFQLVPPGEFKMGVTAKERDSVVDEGRVRSKKEIVDRTSHEWPQHRVRITRPFYLGKHELTIGQWKTVMGTNPNPSADTSIPASKVSWNDIQQFLAKANETSSQQFAFVLPTEAQWEYACRAGTTTRWYFGSDREKTGKYAWHNSAAKGRKQPVGQLLPNNWGLQDMLGNLWELCADRYGGKFYARSRTTDPVGPEKGDRRVARGGGFKHSRLHSRPTYRGHNGTGERHDSLGMRLALAINDPVLTARGGKVAKGDQLVPTGKPIDLLKLIDVSRDSVSGLWTIVNGVLAVPKAKPARLQFPCHVPDEYRIECVIERKQGGGTFVLGFVADGRQSMVVLEGWGSTRCGVHLIDGKGGDKNETTFYAPSVARDIRSTVAMDVRRNGINIVRDGKPVIQWAGDVSRLSMAKEWLVRDDKSLFIGTHDCVYHIHKLTLTPLGPVAPESTPIAGKSSAPAAAKRSAAQAKIRAEYKVQIEAAETPAKKLALAYIWLQKGQQTPRDPVARYALYRMAAVMAAGVGNIETTMAAVDAMDESYKIGAWQIKAKLLGLVARATTGSAERKQYAETAIELAVMAAEGGQQESAATTANLATAAATAAKEVALAKKTGAIGKELAAVGKALSILVNAPNDPEANLGGGRFYCFAMADWDRGLPMLAKCSDARCKMAAQQDLADPTSSDAQAKVGDLWWTLALKEKGALRTEPTLRAARWYRQALPGLSSESSQVSITKRLAQIADRYPGQGFREFDYANGKLRATLTGHTNNIRLVDFSPDSKTLASAGDDKTVRLWDVETAKEKDPPGHQHGEIVLSVAFAPDGKTFASGTWNKEQMVRIWDPNSSKQPIASIKHHGGVHTVAFSPSGGVLAAAGSDKTIRLYDAASRQLVNTLRGHGHNVLSIAFSPDGKRLASSSFDKTVKLWDATSGKEKANLTGHTEDVRSVAFSPDGKLLASGSRDDTIRLWDAKSGKLKTTLKGHTGGVYGVAFSPNGRVLASVSSDKTVILWDLATEKVKTTLRGHTNGLQGVAFSPDGRLLASAGKDNTVRLWEFAEAARPTSAKHHARKHRHLGYVLKKHPTGAIAFGGHWYKFVPGKLAWDEAQRQCAAMGGYLACIETAKEAYFLGPAAAKNAVWIGGYKNAAGRWNWLNGAPATFAYWGEKEPSNKDGKENRLGIWDHGDGRWNSLPNINGNNDGFFCEWEF